MALRRSGPGSLRLRRGCRRLFSCHGREHLQTSWMQLQQKKASVPSLWSKILSVCGAARADKKSRVSNPDIH